MLKAQYAIKYAQAMFDLAKEQGKLIEIEEQLRGILAVLREHQDLRHMMTHPRIPAEAKKETMQQLFAGAVLPVVLNFLLLVIDKRREAALEIILEEFNVLANAERNIAEAYVKSALPLSKQQLSALKDKLSSATCKNIILHASVDANLIGGLVVKIGDKMLDGSVLRQLAVLKDTLNQAQVRK